MLFTIHCPKCGTKQEGLDLVETEGYFYCSACEQKIKIDLEEAKKETLEELDKK